MCLFRPARLAWGGGGSLFPKSGKFNPFGDTDPLNNQVALALLRRKTPDVGTPKLFPRVVGEWGG